MAAKVTKKDYEHILTYLIKTDANYANNGTKTLIFGDGSIHSPRGFLGVELANPTILFGALSTGIGSSRCSIEFEITPIIRGTNINMTYQTSMNLDQRILTIKNFIKAHKDNVLNRMVQRNVNPRQQAAPGFHPRLEGRRRAGPVGPQNEFANAIGSGLFSQEFVTLANSLNIHYR